MKSAEKLTETVRVRVSKSMKTHLAHLAEQRGPGTKLSDLAREAIHQVYFSKPYPITEVTSLRAAEETQKSQTL